MNKTKIDWCEYTWNPVTGCKNNCKYCYARKIANRFANGGWEVYHEGDFTTLYNAYPKALYPARFEPTFYPHRLDELNRKTKGRSIFVCSMADLFGDWIPYSWIKEVLNACTESPHHTYLFLTKNPKRYMELEKEKLLPWSDNFWFGSSLTKPDDEFAWFKDKKFHWFVSIEPILEPFKALDYFHLPEWVIVGAETGNRKDKTIPKRGWIENIAEQCRAFGIPVFMKESLKEIMGNDFVQEYPEGMTN